MELGNIIFALNSGV